MGTEQNKSKKNQTHERVILWAASRLNELCINGLHEAATMTGWLLALITPRSSANKPNQVVMGAADTHSTHTQTHTPCLCNIWQSVCGLPLQASSCLLTNYNCFLALLTNVQLVGGRTLTGEGTNDGGCVGLCQHTQSHKKSFHAAVQTTAQVSMHTHTCWEFVKRCSHPVD